MHGVLADVAASFKDVKVVKIDIDRYPDLATKLRVQVGRARAARSAGGRAVQPGAHQHP